MRFHLQEMFGRGKCTETGRSVVAGRGGGEGWRNGVTTSRYGTSSGGENVLRLDVVTVAQLCECPSNRGIVLSKWAHLMTSVL